MRHFAAAAVLALLSIGSLPSAVANSVSPLDACRGRWQGWGHSDSDWSIDMVVSSSHGMICGTIEYPSLGCGGALTTCSISKDGKVTFVELYDHNPGTCAPAGTIEATCADGKMAWTWTGQRSVSTVLTRQ